MVSLRKCTYTRAFLKLCLSNVMSLQGHSLLGISLFVGQLSQDCFCFMLNHWLCFSQTFFFPVLYLSLFSLFVFSSAFSLLLSLPPISLFLFIFCSPKLSLFLPHLFSFFFLFLLHNLVFTALSCQLQMKSRLCLALALLPYMLLCII